VRGLGLHTRQRIVRGRVTSVGVVTVLCGQQRRLDLPGDLDQQETPVLDGMADDSGPRTLVSRCSPGADRVGRHGDLGAVPRR
jgi:hypothetical protein